MDQLPRLGKSKPTKEYKIRHETPTSKTLSKNYTKVTALELRVSSKLPGMGLKDILHCKVYMGLNIFFYDFSEYFR